jgi:integrase
VSKRHDLFSPTKMIRDDELTRLLGYLYKTNKRGHFMVFLAKSMGLRISEAVCMRIEDFEGYEQGKIVVRVAKKKLLSPKKRQQMGMRVEGYRSSWNERPLYDQWVDRKTIEVCRQFFKWARINPRRKRGWVFPGDSPHGHVLDWKVHQWFVKATKACGIGKRTFHCLRHYLGWKTQELVKDITATRDILRHSNINTTQMYVRRKPEELRNLAERVLGRRRDGEA